MFRLLSWFSVLKGGGTVISTPRHCTQGVLLNVRHLAVHKDDLHVFVDEDLMVFPSLGRFERRHLLADDFVFVPCYLWSGSMAGDIWSKTRDDAGRLLPGIHIDLALVTMAGFG
jgi:hypothetical protein